MKYIPIIYNKCICMNQHYYCIFIPFESGWTKAVTAGNTAKVTTNVMKIANWYIHESLSILR